MTLACANASAKRPGAGPANSRPPRWATATAPFTERSLAMRDEKEESHALRDVLPLADLGLEPRQRALPERRRARAGPPRPRRDGARARRRLEPDEPHRGARNRAHHRVRTRLPGPAPGEPYVHVGGIDRSRRGARRRRRRPRSRMDGAG